MSVIKLNKKSGVPPEEETLFIDQSPPKSLEEIIDITKTVKIAFWDIEHYAQHSSSPPPPDPKPQKAGGGEGEGEGEGGVTKQQLEAHVMRIKVDVVRLLRMLQELLARKDEGRAGAKGEEEDVMSEFDLDD